MRVVVASTNPVKVRAVQLGLERVLTDGGLEVISVAVDSGVSDQPLSREETLLGALRRSEAAIEHDPGASFAVGLEGGIEDRDGEMSSFAWIVVRSGDGRIGKSCTSTFELPREVAERVRSGEELGTAIDRVYGQQNSKRKGGAVGQLTGGAVDRAELYAQAVSLAFIPFRE